MRLVSLAFAAPLVLVSQLLSSAAPACASDVRLNEILAGPARDWDGSGAFSSRDDEWIEIVNVGSAPADLTNLLLTDGDRIPRYGFGGVLDPGGHLLVTGKQSYDWERASGHPAFGLSLGNTGDTVFLLEVVGPDTLVVDSYTYRSHEAAADRASGRAPDGSGGWALFDGLNPYVGTVAPFATGCSPSPGIANPCDLTPTRRASWGVVKSIYR